MPILTFKVSNEVAETVNTLAKKTGISRNEFLARTYLGARFRPHRFFYRKGLRVEI